MILTPLHLPVPAQLSQTGRGKNKLSKYVNEQVRVDTFVTNYVTGVKKLSNICLKTLLLLPR